MTTSTSPTVHIDDPGVLIAAIPPLLGFHPKDSLVVVSTMGDNRIGPILRADLSPNEPDLDLSQLLAVQLRQLTTDYDVSDVHLLVVGGGHPHPPDLPHQYLVEELSDAMVRLGLPASHSLWTPTIAAGEPWYCYSDRPSCAPCAGTVADPSASPLAAAMTYAGSVTFSSREALLKALVPDPPDDLARREVLLSQAKPPQPAQSIRMITDAVIRSATEDPANLSDADLVALANALSDSRIRDHCLSMLLGPRALQAEVLWARLVRGLPPPARAEPAFLLAVSAYLRGNGAIASTAIDIARAASPTHATVQLLKLTLDNRMTPTQLRTIMTKATRAGSL